MDVIGAGFGRTGTMFLKAALERLGVPCYYAELNQEIIPAIVQANRQV